MASSHIEVDWDKRPGTTYLQTWHGTPLKRVHRDVLWAPDGRLDRLDRDIAKWDLLLSPNPVSTPRLRRAFGYDGEVLESGYPRNDLLLSRSGDEVRARLRARAGIPEGATVVLYAPTWRDAEGYDSTLEVPLRLDLGPFGAGLGEDHVLLVRAHNMVTGRWDRSRPRGRATSPSTPTCRPATTPPTCWSPTTPRLMFDFTVTGRPMLFLASDLEEYRDHHPRLLLRPAGPRLPARSLRSTEPSWSTPCGACPRSRGVRRPLRRLPGDATPPSRTATPPTGCSRGWGWQGAERRAGTHEAATRGLRLRGWWAGAGSNRRPSTFQADARTN